MGASRSGAASGSALPTFPWQPSTDLTLLRRQNSNPAITASTRPCSRVPWSDLTPRPHRRGRHQRGGHGRRVREPERPRRPASAFGSRAPVPGGEHPGPSARRREWAARPASPGSPPRRPPSRRSRKHARRRGARRDRRPGSHRGVRGRRAAGARRRRPRCVFSLTEASTSRRAGIFEDTCPGSFPCSRIRRGWTRQRS